MTNEEGRAFSWVKGRTYRISLSDIGRRTMPEQIWNATDEYLVATFQNSFHTQLGVYMTTLSGHAFCLLFSDIEDITEDFWQSGDTSVSQCPRCWRLLSQEGVCEVCRQIEQREAAATV